MKDNEIEDEKSVDVLPFKQLESQKTVLPQDVFRNELTWFCYEMSKSLAFRIWMLLWLPLSVWWKLSNNWVYPLIVSLLFLFLGPIFLLVICGLSRKRSLSKQLTQFCKEITKNTPSLNTRDWEVVAANLNSYLYENKAWNTKYFFFNAMGCQEAFKTTLLEPFSLKKDEAAKVKSFKDSVPYIEEALEVYFTEVEKQWKLFNSEKSWSPVGLEDAKLPKEAHRSNGANGWDEIARKMNRYLFEKKVWNNEEFFFDGIDCEWFFSHFFYRLLSAKKSMWLLPLNVELWPYIKKRNYPVVTRLQ
ncbi:ALH_1b_G0047820.mRNA.1.CDS.1 [Saccharomyces cerevisiae]|nr:ALH_1c_G0047570.mRNA.1.CDS.1 [Saccharomyces cerevisiae]CAI4782307.1 ALH_1b_G0047820.mRNA.1.CDS.1 [Saccharomyces cerevisiae]CAI6870135.1 ALH_1c_G0047570.mRNA.1.CDS.1 [Saccharomyces cerevisiae]CAI6871809.1 ALH_1b_G0047820.mRNA.1.CDS.1 [Saccharomyces cerevisiae]CAI6875828.1 AKR_collapsed_G0048220.mRNA.1.CDS.1 [Saccharomyces cerevisiae]